MSKISNPLFKHGQIIKHVKTSGRYAITALPSKWEILESSWESFYKYRSIGKGDDDSISIYRAQSEMEDGRFVPSE